MKRVVHKEGHIYISVCHTGIFPGMITTRYWSDVTCKMCLKHKPAKRRKKELYLDQHSEGDANIRYTRRKNP